MKNENKTTRYIVNTVDQMTGRIAMHKYPYLFNRVSYTWQQLYDYVTSHGLSTKRTRDAERWFKKNGLYLTEDKEW